MTENEFLSNFQRSSSVQSEKDSEIEPSKNGSGKKVVIGEDNESADVVDSEKNKGSTRDENQQEAQGEKGTNKRGKDKESGIGNKFLLNIYV